MSSGAFACMRGNVGAVLDAAHVSVGIGQSLQKKDRGAL